MTGLDVIREVSLDLNDQEPGHEYTHWTREQLQSYLKEAVIHVSGYNRDWFTATVTVKVQPGGDWQSACDCTKILRIYGESDKDGHVKRYLRRTDDIEKDIWPGALQRCIAPNAPYTMEAYTVNSSDGGASFKIYPPVPEHEARYVSLLCYKRPNGELDEEVPEDAVMAVKQWMLYRAYALDSENNSAIVQLADKHRETFFALVKAAHDRKLEEEARYGSVRETRQNTAE